MSIICHTRCDGSKLRPTVSPNSSSMVRHMDGEYARLFPLGHSSFEKIIGQFSIAILTPESVAWPTISGHTFFASDQLSASVFVLSAPMKVVTIPTSITDAAVMTFLRWSMAWLRSSGDGCSGLG